jgi:hypothetical protein
VAGLLLGAIGMVLLTQLSPSSGYLANVLPALIITGLGFGLVVPPALNSATQGVEFEDAGVTSTMVNTMQQVGGSLAAPRGSHLVWPADPEALTTDRRR